MDDTFADSLPDLWRRARDPMMDLRHDLHAHPELSFDEHRTTAVIRDRLSTLGWDLAPCPTETGAVARLRGARPGRRIMLRADIDALPVHEERSWAHASHHDGVMHACGHDVHTAALLAVADLLAQRRDALAGEYTLVFQPAEEALGGARAMIDGGLLVDHPVDVVLGAHVTSLAPVGLVATRPGTLMSAANALTVHLAGRGGHGAMAQVDGNVVLALSHLVPRLGEVVAGLSFEGTDCACSAGVLRAGSANNVVPRAATALGTLRTFTPGQLEVALERLNLLVAEVAAAFGVTATVELGESAPAVVNDAAITARVLEAAARVVGDAATLVTPPVSPSDDVAELLGHVAGCYLFIGGALADGSSGMHHGPDFAVDDEACRVAAEVLATSAVDLAEQPPLRGQEG
ncbi:MAG: M20 metallopeptidase family protein [Acidimicrobiales bacterium]